MTAKPKTLKLVRVLRHLELWKYPWGRLECARGGCRACHDQVMDSFNIETELLAAIPEYTPFDLPGYEPWEYFQLLCEYVAFRKAHPLKQGRPEQTDKDMIRDLQMGRHAEILHRKGRKLPEAIIKTAKKYLASESSVRDARKEFLDAVKLMNEWDKQKIDE